MTGRRALFAAALGLALVVGLLGLKLLVRSDTTLGHVADRVVTAVVKRLRAPRRPRPHPSSRSRTPAGLGVWTVDDSTKVFPGDLLGTPREPGTLPVALDGARGETVAFQLVIASAEDTADLDVVPAPLTASDAVIGAERVQVFLESYIRCGEVEDQVVSFGPGEYPDALVPLRDDADGQRKVAAPFALKAARNQPLWVDVAIPRDAAAGRYAGALRLRQGERDLGEVRIDLTVRDFEVPAHARLFAWVPLYATRLYQRERLEGQGRTDSLATIHRYFRMARDHGFETQIMENWPELDWDERTGELRHADWRGYDALNGPVLDGSLFDDGEPPPLWKVGGFVWWGARPGDPPNFGGDYARDADLTPAHRRALGEYAHEVGRHFREKGWTRSKLFMYMIDEPDLRQSPNMAAMIRGYGQAIHDAHEGIAHLVTIGPEQTPLAVGAVDIWATWGAGYYPQRMRARQEVGERAWFYQQHEPFVGGNSVNNDGLGLRTWPWIAWRYHVDGVFLWVGDFWNEDPYRQSRNWNDDLLGNGILFYPGALLPTIGLPGMAGPVSSFRMKALRRGQYDYDYFDLLRSLGGNPDAVVSRIMRSALNERELQPHWRHPLWGRPGDWSHDTAEWDAARREIAQEIVKRKAAR